MKLKIRKMFVCIPDDKITKFITSLEWIPSRKKKIITHTFKEVVLFIDLRDVDKLDDGFIVEYAEKGNRPGIWLTRRDYDAWADILDKVENWPDMVEMIRTLFFNGCSEEPGRKEYYYTSNEER